MEDKETHWYSSQFKDSTNKLILSFFASVSQTTIQSVPNNVHRAAPSFTLFVRKSSFSKQTAPWYRIIVAQVLPVIETLELKNCWFYAVAGFEFFFYLARVLPDWGGSD